MKIITFILMSGLVLMTVNKIMFLIVNEYPRKIPIDRWVDIVDLILGVVIITCYFMIEGDK